jgi:NAD/NADP transhydrogenase alpha subunit
VMAMAARQIGKGAADGIGLSAAQVQGRNAPELASERSCALTRSCGVLFDLAQIRQLVALYV